MDGLRLFKTWKIGFNLQLVEYVEMLHNCMVKDDYKLKVTD